MNIVWWLLVGLIVLVLSWLVMIVLAKRLPPGSAKDLASVLPACVTTVRRLRRDLGHPAFILTLVIVAQGCPYQFVAVEGQA